MTTLPIDEAHVVGLALTSTSYGIYLVTFCQCIYVLFWGHSRTNGHLNWTLVSVVSSMFIFLAMDISLSVLQMLDAFVFYKGVWSAVNTYEDISNWISVVQTIDVEVMALIGDGLLIYRCFVVFSRNWLVVVIPTVLWVGNFACCVAIVYLTSTTRGNALLDTSPGLSALLLSFLAITLVTNLLITSLIVWRIWSITHQADKLISMNPQRIGRTKLNRIIYIIIQSGLLYTTCVLITFGTEVAGSNSLYVVSGMMMISVGISLNLIIVRTDYVLAGGDAILQSTLQIQIPSVEALHNPEPV